MATAPAASFLVTFGMGALAGAVLCAWPVLVWRAMRDLPRRRAVTARTACVALAWLALTGGLAGAGAFARLDQVPPRLVFAIVPMFVGVVFLARSPLGHTLAMRTPLWLLVGLQAFRLPLELVMHAAAAEGTMPPQMTFALVDGAWGLNYDILTGASALVLALLVRSGRAGPRAVAIWNVAGLVLLAAIVANAIASLPIIAAFGTDARHLNTWIAFAPFVWLPTVLVGSALLGHLLVFRALRAAARAGSQGLGAM